MRTLCYGFTCQRNGCGVWGYFSLSGGQSTDGGPKGALLSLNEFTSKSVFVLYSHRVRAPKRLSPQKLSVSLGLAGWGGLGEPFGFS